MNKRITSLLLCLVMVFAMLAPAVPVLAAPTTQLKVIPDKTKASPGDIINYSIVFGPVSDLGSIQIVVHVPEGLTYVENSGKLADNIATKIGFDAVEWTEASKRTDPEYPGCMLSGVASAADYESTSDTTMATFQCKVNDGATGNLEVDLVKLEFGSCQTFEEITSRFSVVKTPVTIVAAPTTYTVSFNVNGGSGTMADVNDVSGNYTLPANGFTAPDGKQFKGWAYTADGAVISTADIDVTADTTLYAIWEDIPHTHSLAKVGSNAATCTAEGNKEYYTCSCGKWFEDAAGTTEITEYGSVKIAALGHDYATEWSKDETNHWHECSRCHDHKDEAAHTESAWIIDTAATSTTDGSKHKECTECGYVMATETIPATGGSGGGGIIVDPSYYSITVKDAVNGSISISHKTAFQDDKVTITVKPNAGYELDVLTVTDGNGKNVALVENAGKYTFTMPASNITVKATFTEDEEAFDNPFVDVNEDDWFYGNVMYVYENGIMEGTSKTTFSPKVNTTRGMIVNILYSMEGKPAVTGASSFSDVASGKWYTDAVKWAVDNKIVDGYGNDKFGPEDIITREQLAVILYRYATFKGMDMTVKADLSKFSDNGEISNWSKTALSWANAEGLISGKGNGILDPLGVATRAETAAIMQRYCENVVK